ncbi:XK-related protein 6 [Fragariocoptes setiger]|uniref:XK-related protein n=1 Tax=Fragariocoptes setiger TaxID=1670756 RepID=A0ABQ7S9T7_9ACAR|nr:XK-related protein 6 [Fragariocoptes setiger]
MLIIDDNFSCVWPMEESNRPSVELDLSGEGLVIARRFRSSTLASNRPRITSYDELDFTLDESIVGNTTSIDLNDNCESKARAIAMRFDLIDAAALIFSMCSFVVDMITDIAVAVFHYLNHDWWYFGLTLTFIVIPTIITTSISFRWYLTDEEIDGAPAVSRRQWCVRSLFLILQMGPILRYFESLSYGMQWRKETDPEEKKRIYLRMIFEDSDATMLRLFEAFMESAPQLILQMYILAKNHSYDNDEYWTVVAQLASITTSLISVSWSLVSYSKSLRLTLPSKLPMSYWAITFMFLWELFTIGSRMIALALFTSVYVHHIALVCSLHWAVMFTWIVSMRTSFCNSRLEELGFNAVLAIIFIFCYFNPVDTATRYRYLIFFTFMFVENSALMGLWFQRCDPTQWYRALGLVAHYSLFFAGITLMLVYYRCFHPTGGIKLLYRSDCERANKSDLSK